VAHALELAERRASGEPLQYVTGIAGFRHLELQVGPGVFIPRPETELVAQRAMDALGHGGTLVEIGAGSGAICLSVASERPDAKVLATEVSEEALRWTTMNRDRLGLDVTLVLGDLFDGLDPSLAGSIDVVVSNPPYVADSFNLPREIADHEPDVALFAGDDGMEVIDRLAADARRWLKRGGSFVLEIGEVQRDEVRRSLTRAGFEDVVVHHDMSERPRIVVAVNP